MAKQMETGMTMRRIVLFASLLGATAAAGLLLSGERSWAADASRGQLLYENHCMVCHTSVVHVRERRKANSLEEIETWIIRWQAQLGLNWDSGEVDDVAEFLNQRFYRLESES